jgi:hypothetical protein
MTPTLFSLREGKKYFWIQHVAKTVLDSYIHNNTNINYYHVKGVYEPPIFPIYLNDSKEKVIPFLTL